VTAFLLDEQIKQKLKELREYAEKLEHWYVPGKTTTPGLNRRHVIQSMDIQACFSWTLLPGKPLFRHLSISTKAWHMGNKKSFANLHVAWTLAQHLGFTGGEEDRGLIIAPGPDWAIGKDEDEGTVVVQQPVKDPPEVR